MKRFAVLLAAAVCLPAVIATNSAGAAGCPNEAFRLGPSALLPACRAYEMVSPPEKYGGSIAPLLGFHASPNGSAARFASSASFAGSPASPLGNTYVAFRGDNWATESVDEVQQNPGSVLVHTSPYGSLDSSRTLQVSKVALTPGAIEGGSNVYIRENPSGKLTLVAARPGNTIFNQFSGVTASGYVEGTANWSHVVFRLPEELVPGAPTSYEGEFGEEIPIENVYEYVPGASDPLRLVNILPNGKPTPRGAYAGGEGVAYAHWISSDGSRIFFQAGSGEGPLYLRENGSVTYPVSVAQTGPEAGKAVGAIFGGASSDGSQAYLVSREALTPGSEGGSLYRWTPPNGSGQKATLTNLTPTAGATGPQVQQVLSVSEDGSYVYFTALGELVKGAPESEPAAGDTDVYVWHAGTIRFIAQTEGGNQEFSNPTQYLASPDGAFLSMGSYSPLTPEALLSPACPHSTIANNLAEHCLQVFVYEYATGSLRCASCNGLPPLGDSSIGGQDHREHGSGDETAHGVLDNGTVFMTTPNALVPRDSNAIDDAYAWRASSGPELISTGTSGVPSSFGDATPDGSNVYFFTAQPLVKTDVDADVDVYDDREGGGLAAQWPSTPPGSCEQEGCRGGSPSEPSPLSPGSVVAGKDCTAFAGAATRAAARAKGLAKRAKAVRGKGRAVVRKKRRLRHQAAGASHRAQQLKQNANSCGR